MQPRDDRTVARGYETRDVGARPLAIGAAIGTLVVAASFAAMWTMFVHFTEREAVRSAPGHPLAASRSPLRPPEPRLQTDPRADLLALRAREAEVLGTYAWVDREQGIVRVPIERAIELFVEGRKPAAEQADTTRRKRAGGRGGRR